MPYIKVQITIYKFLGYPTLRKQVIVGNHKKEPITKDMIVELFKKMVQVFKKYNTGPKEVKDDS